MWTEARPWQLEIQQQFKLKIVYDLELVLCRHIRTMLMAMLMVPFNVQGE